LRGFSKCVFISWLAFVNQSPGSLTQSHTPADIVSEVHSFGDILSYLTARLKQQHPNRSIPISRHRNLLRGSGWKALRVASAVLRKQVAMNSCVQHKAGSPSSSAESRSGKGTDAGFYLQSAISHVEREDEHFDLNFAVGFSRQPLPKGNRFAIVTNAGGPGIMATDAAIRNGLELTTLRPETIESLTAKLPPTANFHNLFVTTGDGVSPFSTPPSAFHSQAIRKSAGLLLKTDRPGALKISTAEKARDGFKKITNGVKQRASGARLLGVEVTQTTPRVAKATVSVNPHIVQGKGEGAHVADVRIVLTSTPKP
jgi:hypothetical protein